MRRLLALALGLALAGPGLRVSAQMVVSSVRAAPLVSAPALVAAVLAAPAAMSGLQPIVPTFLLASPYSASALAAPAPTVAAPVATRPLRLLITGPPGVGKTTFGKMLSRDYGMVHISVGELLRAKAAENPELAAIMSRGELVDSELVRRVVTERLARPDVVERGFILDGFPRRPEEIGVIDSWIADGGVIDGLVHLEASDAELLRRILARKRMDDSEEVFRKRMEIYRQQTRPVLEHFKESLTVLEADASGPSIAQNYAKIRTQVEELLTHLR